MISYPDNKESLLTDNVIVIFRTGIIDTWLRVHKRDVVYSIFVGDIDQLL